MAEYNTDKRGNGPVETDNYEMVCENWRKIFLELNHEELIDRFNLEHDENAVYIVYYREKYRVDRTDGRIMLVKEPERKLPFNTRMSIYNLFYYSKPGARIKGEFVPFRQVKRASVFDAAFKKTILEPLAKTFSGRLEKLEHACRVLGGRSIAQGDAGFVVDAFDWMPVTMVFWDGDEEFDAQANLLFDADITDFIHVETVCCIASDLVRRLSEEAGLKKADELLGV